MDPRLWRPLLLAREVRDAIAPEPIHLSDRDVENTGNGADYGTGVTPGTRQATDACQATDLVLLSG